MWIKVPDQFMEYSDFTATYRTAMLTLQDCLGLCDLTEDEITAIAEHEHVPEIVAAELGNYLVVTPAGQRRIKRIILDDIAAATARGDRMHTAKLKLVLKTFCDTHPECLSAPKEAPSHPPSATDVARNIVRTLVD